MNKLHQEESLHLVPESKYNFFRSILAKDRVIFISENITKELSATIAALLLYYNSVDPKKEVTVYINSNGGDALAFMQLYDAFRIVKTPIKTVCVGKAYSAGALLLAIGSQGKRCMTKNASVMIHGIQCTFPMGSRSGQHDNAVYLDSVSQHNQNILKILAKHTGNTLTKVKQDCERDLFLNATEALEYGIIDKII